MSEQQSHINPWADKLQQVSLPEVAEAKEKMLLLLDREMPLPPKKDYRRWIILIVLLLLLLGVCHCPGRPRSERILPTISQAKETGYRKQITTTYPQQVTTAQTFTSNENNRQSHIAYTLPLSPPQSRQHIPHSNAIRSNISYLKKQRNGAAAADFRENEENSNEPGDNTNTVKQGGKPVVITHGKTNVIGPADSASRAAKTSPAIDTACLINSKRRDSTAKKPVVDKRKRKWIFGAGINHALPIGGSKAHINVRDYIPVPQLKYHFNQKWYVQIEAAIHSPQYTPLLLLHNDTSGGVHSTVSLQKLVYLQIPLGIYYSPFPNFYTGAGIRYGRLNDATALYIERAPIPGRADSVLSTTKSLKKDSLYHAIKPTDLQWFADVNYQLGHFLLGMRYNRSIGNFVNLTVPNVQTTTAANQSLQLYFRYTILRQRQKKKSAVKQ